MKKLLLFFVAAATLASCNLSKKQDAVKYNDAIVAQTDKINMRFIEITDAITVIDMTKAEELRKTAVQDCETATKTVTELGAFDGDETFQKAALVYISDLKSMAENEFKSMFENLGTIVKIAGENPEEAEKLQKELEATGTEVEKKDNASSEKFLGAQRDFAKKYDIKLLDNPNQQKIDDTKTELEAH